MKISFQSVDLRFGDEGRIPYYDASYFASKDPAVDGSAVNIEELRCLFYG